MEWFEKGSSSVSRLPVPALTFCCGFVLLCAGGIFGGYGVVISIENSSVVGNTAVNLGGGMYGQVDSTLRVTNTTVEHNTAGDTGGESPTHFVPY
jgi:hypothetical protein